MSGNFHRIDKLYLIFFLAFCMTGLIGSISAIAQDISIDQLEKDANSLEEEQKKGEHPQIRGTLAEVGDLSFYYSSDYASGNQQGLYIYNVHNDGSTVIYSTYQTGVRVSYHSALYNYDDEEIYLSTCSCSFDDADGENPNPYWVEDTYTCSLEFQNQIVYGARFKAYDPGATEHIYFRNLVIYTRPPLGGWIMDYCDVFWKIDFDIDSSDGNTCYKKSPWQSISDEQKDDPADWVQLKYTYIGVYAYAYRYNIVDHGSPTMKWAVYAYSFEDYFDYTGNDQNEDVWEEDIVGIWYLYKGNLNSGTTYDAEQQFDLYY